MQTFITDHNLVKSAQNLDYRRLGKQRVESIQIANCLLIEKSRWKNHPAIKMWKGYESYLIKEYLLSIMNEWYFRGYKNTKCYVHWEVLYKIISHIQPIKPEWITDEFIESHRSNLIRKNYDFYKPKFPNTEENLPYIWPKNY